MKRTMRLISALLALAILFSCCAAAAETCYETLKLLMTTGTDSEGNASEWYMGPAEIGPTDAGTGETETGETEKYVMVIYNMTDRIFMVTGGGTQSEGEYTLWTDVELGDATVMLYRICSIWETVAESADEGWKLLLAITDIPDSEEPLVVFDADTAQQFMEYVQGALNSGE